MPTSRFGGDRGAQHLSDRLQPPRFLGVFAHPDDETICAGGTLAKYASAAAEVRVISLTKGDAGQIRDASVATRARLRAAREKELHAAGKELGLTETRCLDFVPVLPEWELNTSLLDE